jgi:hypothetical protein
MLNDTSNKQLYIRPFSLYAMFWFVLFWSTMFFTSCAGPLDTVTRRALDSAYVGQRYIAKIYLGNRSNLVYTNNSVDGRGPTGVFIDRSFSPWYETDASFFEAGSSGHKYTLGELQELDRDLDFDTFGQGIVPGQVVVIKKISDKSDQVIIEVETVRRHAVTKKYGFDRLVKTKPRASRIHCVFGKEGMRELDQTVLQSMLDQLLTPVPSFSSDVQKQNFILSNYPETPLDDLVELTGLSRRQVLETYYTHVLSQSQFAQNLQAKLVDTLVTNYDAWSQHSGIRIQNARMGENTLELDCEFQEISKSVVYHSPELRAGLLFFDGVTFLATSFGNALAALSAKEDTSAFQKLLIRCSYLYIDGRGLRFPETVTYSLAAEDLRQFAELRISDQDLADRSEILMGTTPVKISLSALKAVETIKYSGPTTWKVVHVELEDSDYEENRAEKIVTITGKVRNTGTWLARDVEVTVRAYDKYGFDLGSVSATLHGFLKPGETGTFIIRRSTKNMRRFKLFLKWKEVE